MTVRQRLERDARRIVVESENSSGVEGEVVRELALALEGLDRCRVLEAEFEQGLLADECTLGTELARSRLALPQSWDPSQLQARLLTLAAERRRQAVTFEDQMAGHYRAVFVLVQRFRMLRPR